MLNPWVLLGLVAAWLASAGAAYHHGLGVAEGRAAESRVVELQTAIDGMVKDIEEREKRDAQATAAIRQFDNQIEMFGRDLRRLTGGCVPTPERLRIFQDATAAANATGFSGPMRGDPPGSPGRDAGRRLSSPDQAVH